LARKRKLDAARQHAKVPPRLTDEAVLGDAGVVDQDVEPAQLAGQRLDRGAGRRPIGDVEAAHDGLAAGGGDQLRGLLRGILAAGEVDHHAGAAPGQRDAHRPPDPARPAGDQGDPPLQPLVDDRHQTPSTCFTSCGSPTVVTLTTGAIRLTSPASTAPEPSSSARTTPAAAR
jgi:hypothetical protein